MTYYVYLLASRKYGTLYIGVTGDPVRRVCEHKEKAVPEFTAKYGVDQLVWYELHDDVTAILREKEIKKWRRDWKIALIERDNPDWLGLWERAGHSGARRRREPGIRIPEADVLGFQVRRYATPRNGKSKATLVSFSSARRGGRSRRFRRAG